MVNVSSEAARWKRGVSERGAGVADGVSTDLMDLITCAPGEPGSSASSIPERSHLCHHNLSDLGKKEQNQTKPRMTLNLNFCVSAICLVFPASSQGYTVLFPLNLVEKTALYAFHRWSGLEPRAGTLGHWDIAPEPHAQRIHVNHTGSRELLKSEF